MKATLSISVVVDVDVQGSTLEEALESAKELKTGDVISFKGDHIESTELKI